MPSFSTKRGDARTGGAPGGYVFEHAALMRRVRFDRLDQVGDEIAAPLQLDVDAAPAFAHQIALPHQPVEDRDRSECEHRQYGNHDPFRPHRRLLAPAFRFNSCGKRPRFLLCRIFCGKPVPTPDQVRGRLFPETAPVIGGATRARWRAHLEQGIGVAWRYPGPAAPGGEP
jgi:hypothetical protein